MKHLFVVSVIAFGVSFSCFAQGHEHHQSHQPAGAVNTRPSHRFVADNNLKTRMDKIFSTTKVFASKENDKKKLQVIAAGDEIERTVQDIFKSCKLEPAADAAIHPVLADILAGAELFKKGNSKDGHDKIHHALLKYDELFDHR